MHLEMLSTERPNPLTRDLDVMSVSDLLTVMNQQDAIVADAVAAVLPAIEAAVDLIVAARARGGRLIYLGAGTSGRLGVLDAVECPPTFGTDPGEVIGIIAGGPGAFLNAVEGAEDDPRAAGVDLDAISLNATDVVVGLAASGRTPYVIGGLDHARELGAATVAVSCNRNAAMSSHAGVAIEVETGPEILTGSTRLKAGTAQKMVCNMLSTASMVRSGKAFHNLMVDLRPTNAKLVDRANRIVAAATGVDTEIAAETIENADGQVKAAVVMLLAECDFAEAAELLDRASGSVREAIVGAGKSSEEV
ncbi:N-acetylmuramic acid 6-phosphate etherase [Rhodococcus erythropolis]|uniref:N-acetylmuramic acid 6-phosphate etherase n=1 Tax=Rhodococcus erythropolis TaxID=1833 RepID=UPI001557A1A4|nr:N-acetylmuramic acid 6-phosphate etherase [Rhodococcus erythropolis]PBI95302.1 N-acetylmuramic acid 6-phosphate etherase [Rhodococcus erythropolis]